mmetsp:Transcript_18052/g.52289  ORF Transcript_18052/g.52289 Transcript_18052/m.52289 type:complete len:257 (+) Transcript_18052:144-914(+)
MTATDYHCPLEHLVESPRRALVRGALRPCHLSPSRRVKEHKRGQRLDAQRLGQRRAVASRLGRLIRQVGDGKRHSASEALMALPVWLGEAAPTRFEPLAGHAPLRRGPYAQERRKGRLAEQRVQRGGDRQGGDPLKGVCGCQSAINNFAGERLCKSSHTLPVGVGHAAEAGGPPAIRGDQVGLGSRAFHPLLCSRPRFCGCSRVVESNGVSREQRQIPLVHNLSSDLPASLSYSSYRRLELPSGSVEEGGVAGRRL